MSARIRKMAALTSPVTLSFVTGLREAAKGREVLLLAVPARQPPEETNNAKRFCEVLYGKDSVKVWKT